jgi:hypothetical protein
MSTEVAMKTESTDHGQNEPHVEDDAVVAVDLSRLRDGQNEFNSSTGTYRNICKQCDQHGLHMKAAKRALQIVRDGDAESWLVENAAVTKYLRILRHGVTQAQLDLFTVESHLAPIDEVAGLDGLSAGRLGQSETDNPHDLGTAAGQAWLGKFWTGRAERDAVLAMAPVEAKSELIEGESPPADETRFDDD